MPGSPGSFHISGEIKIKNNESKVLDSVTIASVEVNQNENLLYSFIPECESKKIYPGEKVLIKFVSPKRLSINKSLNPEKYIDLTIHFYSDGKSLNYKAEKIKLEKAY